MQRIEDKALALIRGDSQEKSARFLRGILVFLSKIYGGIVRFRLFFYHHRMFRKVILGCPVISVGNITVGGTGKTPVVEMLARALSKGGRKVAILSRGYKKRKKLFQKRPFVGETRVVSDGKVIYMNSKDAGDEPYMLARNLDGVSVLVDKDRVRAGSYAVNKLGADVLLLDDGFQYFPVQKTHEIVLIDCTNPFGYGHLLPRGLLREPVDQITRSNFVFLTKAEKIQDTQSLKDEIKKLAPSTEILECVHDPKYLKDITTEETVGLEFLKSRKICSVAAIAVPEGFEDTLRRLGATLDLSFRFRDHHRFTRKEIKEIFEKTKEKGLDTIITTEKDAVRIPHFHFEGVRLLYLRVEIKLVKGAADFYDFVHNICYY
jgi:tetraacyldisaccharide 4'-kinase